jgi:murein DD-endopeptidase MepM/ murein hydrolase activator NlpD
VLSGVGGRVDFNSNQVAPPNLIALAQARALLSGGGAAATPDQPVTANGKAPAAGHFRAGSPVADLTREGGEHETMGLAGYPAHDFFAPSGSPAVAPITGKVVRLSGHDPSEGPVDGPHGPLGWSVYIQGNDGHIYYLTHMGSRSVKVGETVKAGQPIGTVADYAKYGTPSHIHMGVR